MHCSLAANLQTVNKTKLNLISRGIHHVSSSGPRVGISAHVVFTTSSCFFADVGGGSVQVV